MHALWTRTLLALASALLCFAAMSYKQLPSTEHHGNSTGGSSSARDANNGPKTVERQFFRSANARHTAISIAAGTVMMLYVDCCVVRLDTANHTRCSRFGYEQGVFGGIIVGQDFLDYFHNPSPSMQGFVTSVYDLGESP